MLMTRSKNADEKRDRARTISLKLLKIPEHNGWTNGTFAFPKFQSATQGCVFHFGHSEILDIFCFTPLETAFCFSSLSKPSLNQKDGCVRPLPVFVIAAGVQTSAAVNVQFLKALLSLTPLSVIISVRQHINEIKQLSY